MSKKQKTNATAANIKDKADAAVEVKCHNLSMEKIAMDTSTAACGADRALTVRHKVGLKLEMFARFNRLMGATRYYLAAH